MGTRPDARFFETLAPASVDDLAALTGGEVVRGSGRMVAKVAPLSSADGDSIAFLGDRKFVAALAYVARAITPPGRTRRFDARFFMADARALLHPEPTAGSGELDEIAWLPLADARALDLPAITRFVLTEVGERLLNPKRPLPFVRMVRDEHVIELQD